MNQTVDARDNLRKSAERRHGDNLDRADRTDRIILLHDFPRVVLGLFEAKRNFLVFRVNILDVYINRVAHIDDLGRMLNTVPAQLGNMNHAVHAAEVDKRAVARERFNDACIMAPDLDLLPELVLKLFALLAQNSANRTDRTLALAVDLEDFEVDLLLEQVIKAVAAGQGRLRGGNKDLYRQRS